MVAIGSLKKEVFMERRFKADMAKTLTLKEILKFWVKRQRDRKKQGRFFYHKLVDPITGKVIKEVS